MLSVMTRADARLLIGTAALWLGTFVWLVIS